MAIVPLLVNLARELEADRGSEWEHYLDDDFGFGLHPMDIFRQVRGGGAGGNHGALMLAPRRRYTPYSHALTRRGRHHKGGSGFDVEATALLPTVCKDGMFQMCMDVSQFKPNELTVKTVDKTIVVEGKHEEREDEHGVIQRHFVRKYTLPKDYDPKEVVSTISSDGVLTVKAPPPPGKAIKQNERIVQIQQTGPAHLSVKAPEPEATATDGKASNGGDKKSSSTSK